MRVSAYDRPDGMHPLLRAACTEADHGRPTRVEMRGYEAGATLLRALASPARLALIDELRTCDRCVHELMESLELPQTQVSQHLRVLKDARLVTSRRRGREVVYSLLDEHAAQIAGAALAHAWRSR